MIERYRFDRTRMEFRKVTHSAGYVLGKVLKYFLVTVSLAVVYYAVFALFVSTDSERELKEQNAMYRKAYERMQAREDLIEDVLEGIHVKDDGIYRQLFNGEAPDLEGLYPQGLQGSVDTIRAVDIVAYTRKKAERLEDAGKRIDGNFAEVMAFLEEGGVLPPLSSPLEDFTYQRTGASIGPKIDPFYKVRIDHGGLDMIAQQGDPVLAAAEGVVSEVTMASRGLGNVVGISHEGGYVTRYAHLENVRVAKGQKVAAGKQIAQVGMSGNSFAPHLHYEVYRDTARLDPLHHFFASVTPDSYMKMLSMSLNAGQSMD